MSPPEYRYTLVGDRWVNLNDSTLQGLFAAREALGDRGFPMDETKDITEQIDARLNELKELSTLRRWAPPHYGEPVVFGGMPALFAEFPFGRAVHIPVAGGRGPYWFSDGTERPDFSPTMFKIRLYCRFCNRPREAPIVPTQGLTLVFPCTAFGLTIVVGTPVHDDSRAQAQELPTTAVCDECLGKGRKLAEGVFTGRGSL